MLALTVAAVLILLITLIMYAVEQWERMRERARATRAAERGEEVRRYWEDRRRRTVQRIEAEAVEDLRMDLDMYGVTGFLWLDEQKRREEG